MNQQSVTPKFYRAILFLFLCISPFSFLHAEGDEGNSNIKGTILTNEGLPAAGVTVSLKGTKKNSITDDDGNFHFKNIGAGDYELEVHLSGYETIQKEVSVSEGKTAYVHLRLEISEKNCRR